MKLTQIITNRMLKKTSLFKNQNNSDILIIKSQNLYINYLNYSYYEIIKNGSSAMIVKNGKIFYLNNQLKSITSRISCDGPIINYILECSKINTELTIVIPFTDSDPFLKNTFKLYKNTNEILKKNILFNKYNKYLKIFGNNFIILLGNFYKNVKLFDNIYLMPFCNICFQDKKNIKMINKDPINTKINKCVWRGSTTGGKHNSLRNDVINILKNTKNCNVCFSHKNNFIDKTEMSKYKAILYIDGKAHPSSIDWIFTSGSVPIFISNWKTYLDNFLVPWEDYVPIKQDLSDLKKNIDFVLDNKNNKLCQQIILNGFKKFTKYVNKEFSENMIKKIIL